jgi:hypothetical protein
MNRKDRLAHLVILSRFVAWLTETGRLKSTQEGDLVLRDYMRSLKKSPSETDSSPFDT